MRIGPFITGNQAAARVRSFDLAQEARQMEKFARCSFAKTTANRSNSFCHINLISSVNRHQRPLITYSFCRDETLAPFCNFEIFLEFWFLVATALSSFSDILQIE
jgi:hypothetical protein